MGAVIKDITKKEGSFFMKINVDFKNNKTEGLKKCKGYYVNTITEFVKEVII